MKGGEGLPNVPAGIQGALHKGTEMGSQLAEKAREMQTMASQEVSQASSAAAKKERQMDATLGAAQEAAAANVSATLDSGKQMAEGNLAKLKGELNELGDFKNNYAAVTANAKNTLKKITTSAKAYGLPNASPGQTSGGRRRKRRQRGGDNGSTTMAEAEEGAKRDGAVKQLVEELKASIRNVEAAERKMNMNGTHGIPEQEHLEEALAALEKMVTAENKLRTEFKKQVRARVSAIHADPMDHAANLLDSGRSQLTTALRRTQNDAKKAVTGVVDQAVEDANNLISGEDGEDGGNSENNRGILGRIASIFGGKKRRRKSKGKKKRKGRKTKRRPKKGQRSKTRKGRLDFVTHKGDKYYNRNGHRQTRNRKGKKGRPYASRKRR